MPKPSAHAPAPWPVYLLFAALVVLHLMLAPHVSVFGATPDFLLVLAACIALMHGSRTGCVAGFACGLLFDLTGTGPVGLAALLGCAAGYVLGKSQRNVLAEGWRQPLATFAVAAFAYNALYVALLAVLGDGVVLGWAVVGRVCAASAVDVAVAAAAFAVVARFGTPSAVGPGGFRLS